MNAPDDIRSAALRPTLVLLLLTIAALGLDAVFWQSSYGHVPVAHTVAIAAAAVLAGVLFARRHRPTLRLTAGALVIDSLAVMIALWFADDSLARGARAWVPFQSHKLAVLTIALIAPAPTTVTVLLIAAFSLSAAEQYVTFPSVVRDHLAAGEPWATLAFGAVAIGVLVHRRRTFAIELRAARARAEATSLARLARIGLAARDLANTPLQTLRFIAEILRRRHPEEAPDLDRMNRALDRLAGLDQTLSRYEDRVEWHPGDEAFDPVEVLEDAARDHAAQGGAATRRQGSQRQRARSRSRRSVVAGSRAPTRRSFDHVRR